MTKFPSSSSINPSIISSINSNCSSYKRNVCRVSNRINQSASSFTDAGWLAHKINDKGDDDALDATTITDIVIVMASQSVTRNERKGGRVHFSIKLISIPADAKLQEINHRTSSTDPSSSASSTQAPQLPQIPPPPPEPFSPSYLNRHVILVFFFFVLGSYSSLSSRTLIFALSSICRE